MIAQVNLPDVLAELEAIFDRYECALVNNDVDRLNALFWRSTITLRYGVGENLYGFDAIADFRARRRPQGLERTIRRRLVTTFGRDVAVTNIEFERDGVDRIGRQSQTWVRFPEGWRIVAAHVSWMDTP
ncbi:oxalurate catabolism protein HpxZ [Thiomonas sp. FB-Cd]|uniref:oxalurate catabolism protein HpxZ n=1 Tax=Thiomonas sp. FB-Cd TaxID=1158292 RepID=UPI0004DEFF94|nr:oxalurate catabolism protein HpxZ [Thiomonas sp. FB-Cd]